MWTVDGGRGGLRTLEAFYGGYAWAYSPKIIIECGATTIHTGGYIMLCVIMLAVYASVNVRLRMPTLYKSERPICVPLVLHSKACKR